VKNDTTDASINRLGRPDQVLILPGKLFFVETIDVPEELEPSEIPDFAELSLESMSPFPIDRIYWGYTYHNNAATLLVYAAHRERIKNEGFTDLEEYAWVVPDFATLSGAHFHDDTLVVLEGDQCVNLLYFEKKAVSPQSFWVDATDASLVKNTIQSLRSCVRDLPKTAPTLHLGPAMARMNESGIPTFEHSISEYSDGHNDDGHWQQLTPSESQLWQMDVRNSEFKTSEQHKRSTRALISRITGWAAIFAIVLVLFESVLFASQNWLDTQFSKVKSQQVAVSKVEEKQILVSKLEQVAQNELRPIEMLEAANNIRLKLNVEIEYDSVIIEGENQMTIEGKANSVGAYNRYKDGLENSGLFEVLAKEDKTDKGKTTFRVNLVYYPNPTPSEETTRSDKIKVGPKIQNFYQEAMS